MAEMSSHRLTPLAVLAGVRTPLAKAFGALANVPADQLGRIAVETVLPRANIRPADVGEVVFGNVAGQADASNIARVIARSEHDLDGLELNGHEPNGHIRFSLS